MRAARWAFWIGFRFLAIGEPGRASGWLPRAQRLVDRESTECVVSGYLLLPLIRRHLAAGDHDQAYDTAASAAAIGERFGEPISSVRAADAGADPAATRAHRGAGWRCSTRRCWR